MAEAVLTTTAELSNFGGDVQGQILIQGCHEAPFTEPAGEPQ